MGMLEGGVELQSGTSVMGRKLPFFLAIFAVLEILQDAGCLVVMSNR